MIDEILEYNRRFVAADGAAEYATTKFPDKKVAIVTCMDTRLTLMLPAALGLRNGDVKMIKNAGGLVHDPYGEAMRSLLVAIYELGVEDVMVIAHTDCGACHMDSREMIHAMKERGISDEAIAKVRAEGVDLDTWLTGFGDYERSVRDSVATIRRHPLVPSSIRIHGFIMDTASGELRPV